MSLPRGIRYETLPESLLQGKAFPQHIEGFLGSRACVDFRIVSDVSVYPDSRHVTCVWVCFRFVCVFYDSECIPFELHAIYMCALYFFSKRRGFVCTRVKFSCMSVLFFCGLPKYFVRYYVVIWLIFVKRVLMYFSVLYRRYENRGWKRKCKRNKKMHASYVFR